MSSVTIQGNPSGTGIFTVASPNSNTNQTLTLPDSTGTLLTQNSQPSFVSTIGVGGATPANTGAGITFPATKSPSSNANTLDDYEEGTWTPVVSSGGGTISSTGVYTKVGRLVSFSIDAQLGGTRNGNPFVITGLPFVNNGTWAALPFYCQVYNKEGVQQVSGAIEVNSNNLRVIEFGAEAVGTDFGNGYFNIAGTYASS